MGYWFLCGKAIVSSSSCLLRRGFNYQQNFSVVNVKLKWVKDKALDAVIAGERDLRSACSLVSILSSASDCCLPIYHLSRKRRREGARGAPAPQVSKIYNICLLKFLLNICLHLL
ncbi:Uncharacterized protein TCM_020091 [Theobroma cacao]|uniref:PORR domain-containing protein n=1 Tax=Theobroma cacao TaxID=3641 RepID=A0A061EJA4_THECC|nr:Uncharacterized protein TCM_020091 [Theobroma cacao]